MNELNAGKTVSPILFLVVNLNVHDMLSQDARRTFYIWLLTETKA